MVTAVSSAGAEVAGEVTAVISVVPYLLINSSHECIFLLWCHTKGVSNHSCNETPPERAPCAKGEHCSQLFFVQASFLDEVPAKRRPAEHCVHGACDLLGEATRRGREWRGESARRVFRGNTESCKRVGTSLKKRRNRGDRTFWPIK